MEIIFIFIFHSDQNLSAEKKENHSTCIYIRLLLTLISRYKSNKHIVLSYYCPHVIYLSSFVSRCPNKITSLLPKFLKLDSV